MFISSSTTTFYNYVVCFVQILNEGGPVSIWNIQMWNLTTGDFSDIITLIVGLCIGGQAMPAKSKKQQQLMAIAEHNPEDISAENKGVLKMSKSQLHEFSTTNHKGLPVRVKKEKKHTTVVKPDAGPKASKGQQKQINEIIK